MSLPAMPGYRRSDDDQPATSRAPVPHELERAHHDTMAAMDRARRFRRSEQLALTRMLALCEEPDFAELATYQVDGGRLPGVEFARAMATSWGNVEQGYYVVQRRPRVIVRGFALDLETNVAAYAEESFNPERMNAKAERQETRLAAAYAVRAAILSVIPPQVREVCLAACIEALLPPEKRMQTEEHPGVEPKGPHPFQPVPAAESVPADDLRERLEAAGASPILSPSRPPATLEDLMEKHGPASPAQVGPLEIAEDDIPF